VGLFGKQQKEENMRTRLLAAAAVIAAFATPALADFYVVQDSGTKRCSIVEQRPTTQTSVIVGDGKVYTTRVEAENAMKTVKVCEHGGTVGGPAVVPAPR
jgi:vancomycin permeability regulator SanA